jgi:two-component system chemotaxis response regulator CheB
MPRSALEHVDADLVSKLSEIGGVLARLTEESAVAPGGGNPGGEMLEIETRIAAAEPTSEERVTAERLGPPSPFSCPECNGVLYEVRNGLPMRFRCRVGHAYSAKSLIADQAASLEAALWTALRVLEENAALAARMAERSANQRTAAYLHKVAADRRSRAEDIRRGLMELSHAVVDEPA